MMREMISKVEPLHIQVYNILKNSIINGEFQPGERITEVGLAKMLSVSRGPVREVIRMLIQDGLLVQEDGQTLVYQPTKKDINEVFLCRESLEGLATRLAADNMTADIKEQFLSNIKQTKESIERQDANELSRLDQQFHEMIIKTSQNKQLIQIAGIIQAKVAYMRNQILSHFYKKFVDTVDEHYHIVQLLVEGDASQAEKQMRVHISKAVHVYNYLVK